MNYFMNLVMSGLVIGTLYGMVAMGFAIIYRATGMVNFAQGEVMMLIAYMSYTFANIPGDRKSTRLNSSHGMSSRMPSSA